MTKEYLTMKEFCKFMKLTENQVLQLMRKRRLYGYSKIGKYYYFKLDEVYQANKIGYRDKTISFTTITAPAGEPKKTEVFKLVNKTRVFKNEV